MGYFTRQVNVTEIQRGYVKYERFKPEVISFACFQQSSPVTHYNTVFCENVRPTQHDSTCTYILPMPQKWNKLCTNTSVLAPKEKKTKTLQQDLISKGNLKVN